MGHLEKAFLRRKVASGSGAGIMRFLSYTPFGVGATGVLTQGSASLHPWATILRRFAAERPVSEQHWASGDERHVNVARATGGGVAM